MTCCLRVGALVFACPMFFCMSICLSVCLSPSLTVCLYVAPMCICLSVYLSIYMHALICVSIYLSICQSVCLSICRYVYLYACLYACMYACMSPKRPPPNSRIVSQPKLTATDWRGHSRVKKEQSETKSDIRRDRHRQEMRRLMEQDKTRQDKWPIVWERSPHSLLGRHIRFIFTGL